MKCDECGKKLSQPSEIYTASANLPTLGCTVTDLIFCEKCFKALKGKSNCDNKNGCCGIG